MEKWRYEGGWKFKEMKRKDEKEGGRLQKYPMKSRIVELVKNMLDKV